MADLRAALGHALEPAYRVEREVRPVGNCRMFVALEKSAGGGLLVNVLPADGQALVADTGILGALVPALTGDGGGAATAALCAADYLAPERRAGQPAPATRDDMFAVGVLVHEMLTGRPPAGNPEPLEEVRSVPDWLAELGRRCRAAEPSARWADAGSALASGSWPSGGG